MPTHTHTVLNTIRAINLVFAQTNVLNETAKVCVCVCEKLKYIVIHTDISHADIWKQNLHTSLRVSSFGILCITPCTPRISRVKLCTVYMYVYSDILTVF